MLKLRLSVLFILTIGSSACQVPGMWDPDVLAGHPAATPIDLPAEVYQGGIAVDSKGEQLAYATPDGLFVMTIGGAPQKLSAPGGSVTDLAWSPDSRFLILSEREIEPHCVGNQCSSGLSEDVYRLQRVSVDDGTVTTLAEHVFGLHSIEAAPAGRWMAYQEAARNLTLLDPEAGTTESLSGERNVESFAWSPQGDAIAFRSRVDDASSRVSTFCRVAIESKQVQELGGVDGELVSGLFGPIWKSDGTAIRAIGTNNSLKLPVTEFSILEEKVHSYEVELQNQTLMSFSASPDGSRLVATKMKSFKEAEDVVNIGLDAGTVTHLAPPVAIYQWVGGGSRVLATVGRSWPKKYYLLDLPKD